MNKLVRATSPPTSSTMLPARPMNPPGPIRPPEMAVPMNVIHIIKVCNPSARSAPVATARTIRTETAMTTIAAAIAARTTKRGSGICHVAPW